jgi:hypothetical protein
MRVITLFLSFVLLTTAAVSQQAVPPPPKPEPDKSTQQPKVEGPSFEDTEKWIQDHIGDSGFPAGTSKPENDGSTWVYDDAPWTVKFDGCDMHLSITSHSHYNDNSPPDSAGNTDSRDDSDVLSFNFPLGKLSNFWVNVTQGEPYYYGGSMYPDPANVNVPSVLIQLPDAGVGTFSNVSSSTVAQVPPPITKKPIVAGLFPVKLCSGITPCRTVQGIVISYARPGTDDAPLHMAKALSHLAEICRKNPDLAPKDLF